MVKVESVGTRVVSFSTAKWSGWVGGSSLLISSSIEDLFPGAWFSGSLILSSKPWSYSALFVDMVDVLSLLLGFNWPESGTASVFVGVVSWGRGSPYLILLLPRVCWEQNSVSALPTPSTFTPFLMPFLC